MMTTSDLDDAPHLTAKGRRMRAQILETAATLIHRNGVTATTLGDVRQAARVSSSQLYHYFQDKQALVRAVVDHQAEAVVRGQHAWDLGTLDGFRAWRDDLVRDEQARQGRGGCPLGSLGADLAETDPQARQQVARGFDRWADTIHDGLKRMQDDGSLPPETDVAQLALGILAALQGGLLLSQIHRDAVPLQAALDTSLALLESLSA